MHKIWIKTLILILIIVVSHHDSPKKNSKTNKIDWKKNQIERKRIKIETWNEEETATKNQKKKKKMIRVLMEETRNQTEENRVVAIAEAEQAWTCSDTIREE